MTRRLLLAAGVSFLMTVAPASGGTPFGGDDPGFVPPNPPVKRCEEGVLKSATRLARCLFKCHKKAADFALKAKPFDEEACEQGKCLDQFGRNRDNRLAAGGCPACLDAAGQDAIGSQVEAFAEALNGDIYCTAGTPFGGDDPGNVPPDKDTARCQGKVANNLGQFMKCVGLAHQKAARQAFRGGVFDDESNEQGKCRAKYDAAAQHLVSQGGCPACLDTASQVDIGTQGEDLAEGSLGAIYCASPSGAFVGETY